MSAMTVLDTDHDHRDAVNQHRPWPRVVVTKTAGGRRSTAGARPLHAARPVGRARARAHGAAGRSVRRHRGRQLRLHRRAISVRRRAARAGHAAGARHPRSLRSGSRRYCRTRGPGSIIGRWDVRHPLGKQATPRASLRPTHFLPAEGEGLHQIPVGPVHAGIIEPGHFRFTANGETVVRLEERLGYVHKGIEQLMQGATLEHGAQARRAHLRRQHGRLCVCVRAGRGSGARQLKAPPRAHSICAR